MGMHASGEVFYGYDLGDLTDRETFEFIGPAWLEEDEAWEDRYARARGIELLPYPSSLAGIGDHAERRSHPDYLTWSASRDQVRQAVKEAGCELDRYGYLDGGEHCWRVQVKASRVRSEYDCVRVEIDEANPLDVQLWRLQLDEFMRALELPVPDDGPRWYLTSSYG